MSTSGLAFTALNVLLGAGCLCNHRDHQNAIARHIHTHDRQTDILTQCFAGPGTGARPGCGHLKYGIRFEVKVWSLTGTRAHEHDRPAYGQSDKEMEQEDDKMDGAKGHQG